MASSNEFFITIRGRGWALWKAKRTQDQAGRNQEIRELLEAALKRLER